MIQNYKLLLVLLFLYAETFAQIGIGTVTPTGALDVTSATNGLVIPRVALTAANVSAPVANPQGGGLTVSTLIYNTATAGTSPNTVVPGFYYWNGTRWIPVGSSANSWQITGNSGLTGGNTTTAGTNFIGTTDAQNLDFRTNNNFVGRFSALGEFFVGTLNTVLAGDLMNGVSNGSFPWAINGYSSFNGSGVYGMVQSGTTIFGGVQGEYYGTAAGAGVRGIYGSSGLGTGVNGQYAGTATTGIRAGVRGQSLVGSGNQQIGVLGEYNGSAWGIGLLGIGFGGAVPAGNNDIAVVGWSGNNSNYSGYFNGNHVIANGTKSASVGTSKGNQLLYVAESPEVWFEDIGRAKLINGYVEVKLDPLFLETVFIDDSHPMSVFLQEEGESNGLYVIPGKEGFIVKEKNGGTSNIAFSYRIMAKRLNFQDHRFGNDPLWGGGDTRKYSSYATPPPVDHEENKRFQEAQKRNYTPAPLPEGFKNYAELQKEMVSGKRDAQKK
ncbi:MAG TPA: hypothetical protein VGB50_03800 [Flavobacterium sp.]|jgi:hypothetical protein